MQLLSIKTALADTGGRNRFFFRYLLLFVLLIFCIFQFHIYNVCGFSIYPDEFGYWASAARAVGYDWHDAAGLGAYYSFGYGMILAPILWSCKDSITAYRAAIAVNMLLQCCAVGILWKIYQKLHHAENEEERQKQVVLAVGLAAFYPPWLFYAQMTLAEALLLFLYVFLCWRLLLFVENPNVVNAALMALTLLYLHFVHMRTIAVVIAALLMLALYARRTPFARKSVMAACIILAVGMVCGMWIKGQVMDGVYRAADQEFLSANDYAGQLWRMRALLTVQGIRDFLVSIAGKCYYLLMASYGLLTPAVSVCLKKTGRLFVRSADQECFFYFFCLLSLAGQTIVAAAMSMTPGRLDGFIYGRYSEHILPVFLGIGLFAFCESEHKLRVFTWNAAITAALFAIAYKSALQSGLTLMQGYFAPALSYLSNDWNLDIAYDVTAEFPKAFFMGMALMVCVMCGIWAAGRFRKYRYVLGIFLLAETLLAMNLEEKYTKPFNDVNYYNLRIAQYISEYEGPVTYLYGGGFPYIDLIQFALREREVEIIRMRSIEDAEAGTEEQEKTLPEWLEGVLPEDGFLITDQTFPYPEALCENYQRCCESQAFVLYRDK